jgi:release factor glutamine methyltransferase
MQALTKMTKGMLVADLGTGTGAIALSLASEYPDSFFVASDYSAQALKIAQSNAKSNHIYNVLFWRGDWLTAVKAGSLDMIVTNPPYIEQGDPHLKQGDVIFEPIQALASGVDGLDDIRKIIIQSTMALKPRGWLMIEHGYRQADPVKLLFEQAGFEEVECYQDFGGNDRVTAGQLAL